MATPFPTFEDWTAQQGIKSYTSGSDAGGERFAPGTLAKYNAAKYGLNAGQSVVSSPTQNIGAYENLFDSMAKGVPGSELPIMNLSPERRAELIRAAASTSGNAGDFRGNFDSQLTPQEASAVEQYRAYKAPGDIWDTVLPLAFTAGFGGLVAPSLMAAGAGAGSSSGVAAAGAGAAEAGAGTSWLTGGLPSGVGMGGVGSSGLGLTAATGAGGGLGLIAPAATAAGTSAGGLGSFVSGLLSNSGLGAGDLVKGGLNFLINQGQAKDLQQAGLDAAAGSNPLNAPQRQQYQQQLQQLLQNPETFYSTNPAVKAQLDMARQQFEANSAKMGVGGTQFNDYLKNVQNIASGTYNDQAKLLAGLGGFTFPGGNSASTAYQGAQDASRYGSESFRGLGGIADKLFSGMNKMGQASNEFSLG